MHITDILWDNTSYDHCIKHKRDVVNKDTNKLTQHNIDKQMIMISEDM